MHRIRTVLVAIVVLFSLLVTNSAVFAQESSFQAAIRSTDQLKPVLVLTNNSAEPCQVVASNLGTVSVSKMTQEGTEITPLPITVGFDDGLEDILSRQLRILQPGESVEIALQTLPYQSDHALQTITWSKETGPFGMMYPFKKDLPYTLEVTYSSPIVVTSKVVPFVKTVKH